VVSLAAEASIMPIQLHFFPQVLQRAVQESRKLCVLEFVAEKFACFDHSMNLALKPDA
jgi:hypothetical protein